MRNLARLRFPVLTSITLGVFVTLGSLGSAPPIAAQQPSRGQLTVDRLWGTPEFIPAQFGPARWLDDGTGYTTLEPSAQGAGVDIVRCDPKTGQTEVMVPAAALTPSGARQPIDVEDYRWSPDGRQLLVFTDSQRVWRDNTRGDYWVFDRKTKDLHQLGEGLEPNWLMFAKFAPQGDRVAYLYKNDIWVESLADGKRTQLTKDGSKTIINGTFDWVYEEEFHVQDGFRWSPDGARIAYWQLDASGVGEFYLIDNLSDVYSKIVPVQYPKVGTTNSACRVGVVPADASGPTVWMKVDGDPRENYIARMEWAASSDEIVMQHLDRLQHQNAVVLGDAATGDVRTILVDRDDAWLDVVDDLRWLDGGMYFTWLSERDGWRHLYVVPRTGGELRLCTPGDYDVVEIAHLDVENGQAYLIASPENPAQRFLYRVPLAGGELERLTPPGAGGVHEYQISPDARWAIHTWSTFGNPPVIELVELPSHRVVRTLRDNARLRAAVGALDRGASAFFRVDIGDGLALDGWSIEPPDFDPNRRWPVIFHVYGEPAAQTVLDEWGGHLYLWHVLLSQRGYVILSLDNRGTPAPRGREFRKAVYGQVGTMAAHDQAAGLGAVEKKWSWVDPARIGIWGWSGGGSMTLSMLFRYPKRYQVGVAVAPVPDELLYDTIYQERYMGLPSTNPDGYRDASPITHARGLEGDLLVIHGTGDDNVHYQGVERLVDELVKHDKHFTMMAYPNRSHGIYERPNTRRHLFKLMTRYFLEHLPPGPR